MKILCCGSFNKDLVYNVDHIVMPGETIAADDRNSIWGGKGLNQAFALAKSFDEVYMAGIVNIQEKESIEAYLDDNNIKKKYVKYSDSPSGHAIIFVDKNGQNAITIFHGCNYEITKDYVDEVLKDFSKGDILVLQNEVNLLDYLIDKAFEIGMKVVLNPSPLSEEIMELPLDKVGLFVINEIEGHMLSNETDPDRILENIHNKFPRAEILLTLGEEGSIFYDGKNKYRQDIYKVKAVDTTAAGDTFLGFFVSAIAKGEDTKAALDLAAKASAITVSGKGATPSIPSLSMVQNYSFK